jgi:3',5'-cyclic AMP phosphodiesterase CpdA
VRGTVAGRWSLLVVALTAVLLGQGGCPRPADLAPLLPAEASGGLDLAGFALVARIAQVTDTHVVDTLSPARFAGLHAITLSAWRPYEAYAMQLLDGDIRMVNRIHASGRRIDFLLHTGDACDNAQGNELGWVLTIMDGGEINPLSGPDDRPVDQRPDPALDPYAPFQAQGLYQTGRHGDLPSIPWYALVGNHEVYAIGVLPIFESKTGHRTAPLPLDARPGWLLPVRFDPVGSLAYGNCTPAHPGPPALFEAPRYVVPNPARAYFSKPEYQQALTTTVTGPPGHGVGDSGDGPTWYSVSPVAGLRLIGLDTTDRTEKLPGHFYDGGAMSQTQLAFLQGELDAAAARGEIVLVATHHPSDALDPSAGSEVTPEQFRAVLSACPSVVAHVCGHSHRNRVTDRGTYIEIETCSTLDLPQEGRLIEIWHRATDDRMAVAYETFSQFDDTLPALGDDPLRALREQAHAIALGDKLAPLRQRRFDPTGADPSGRAQDRAGVVFVR